LHDITSEAPIGVRETLADLDCEYLQVARDELQFPKGAGVVMLTLYLLFNMRDTLAQTAHPWLNLLFRDETFRIAIDQTREPLAQFAQVRFIRLLCPGLCLGSAHDLRSAHAAGVLLFDVGRIFEQAPNFCPHRHLNRRRREWGSGAEADATIAMRIAAQAPIIATRLSLTVTRVVAGDIAGEGCATHPADEQPLQQELRVGAWRTPLFTPTAFVLGELLLDGDKERGFDQRGRGNGDPLLGGAQLRAHGASWMFRVVMRWPQGQTPPRDAAGAAIGRFPLASPL
jgi:hypothetical protein